MAKKETFETRQRYNAEAVKFVDRLMISLVPFVLVAFLLYPAGILHSERYTSLGYMIFNLSVGAVAIIKALQIIQRRLTTPLMELIVLLLIVITGCSLLLFVTGFQHPVVIFWLIPVLIAYLDFGTKGYTMIALITFAVAAADIVLQTPTGDTLGYAIVTFMYGAALNVVAFILIHVLNLTANTERHLARTRDREIQQRDKLQAVIDNLAEGLIAVTPKGVINLQNGTALGLLDTNQTLIGKHLDDILHLTDTAGKPVKAKKLLSAKREAVYRDDLKHRLSVDDSINLGVLVTPIRSSYGQRFAVSKSGFVIILRDITKQKSLDEERDEFISVVSHELRTPVAVAEGSVDNLVLFLERGADQETVTKIAKTAHEQIVFLAAMLNDLGTLSRAERGVGDTTEEININELCQQLYDKSLAQAQSRQLELKLDVTPDLPVVVQSRLYLEETLQNFLNNAIKYTKTGSVTLEAHLTSAGVECAVSDTGIGISASDQKRIFEKFYRSEDYRTRETGGTGLGLYVVKKLVAKMGIKMNMESHLNKGSRFSVTLVPKKKS